ncbi:MAG: RagB/SusD family nutrient uptake outer membrane protein [Tannerella sp.]|nr:RagB/SusD family nutrient uptake outer membrane protein [Tannerella sp.]
METEETFFTSYENFKTYAWQFYGWYNVYALNQEYMDTYSDNGFHAQGTNPYGWDKIVEPTGVGAGGWNYSGIRTINVLLDCIDKSPLSDSDKAHWKAVGFFFKAQEYFHLLSRFGTAVWEEHAVTEKDRDILYGAATPRVELARKILELLLYARDNIKPSGDGNNTINTNVVNALISRFGLFEGTWQKYHQVSDGSPNTYLQASYDASSALMEIFPGVHPNYNEVFNSEDLGTIPSVLLYKVFVPAKGHTINRWMGSSESWYEACADLVQSYLCTDGRPVRTSADFHYDPDTASIYEEFRNRDRRLYYSVCPPYRINSTFQNTKNKDSLFFYSTPLSPYYQILFADSPLAPEDEEYVELMKTLSTPAADKPLPIRQWNDEFVREVPHFRNNRYNMSQVYSVTIGGYFPWKIYTPANQTSGGTNDAPIYRMGEVLINHAETAWELGKFDQQLADKTINVLRQRAYIAPFVLTEIDANFDPKRDKGGHVPATVDKVSGPTDYEVNPVLWEIRRERRVELYCEGFRFDDLRRWAKGHYIGKRQVGIYIRKSDYENSRHITYLKRLPPLDGLNNFSMQIEDPTKDDGRIVIFATPEPGWLNKYYLYPLPLDDLTLNPHLKQTPGYKDVIN